jgi:hypothetical protein
LGLGSWHGFCGINLMTVFIYTLSDPTTNVVRYIGKTKNLAMRYHNHCNKRHNEKTHKRNWINSLMKKGLKPVMEVLDIVPESEWIFWEKYWVNQFIVWGYDLVNNTEGGDGLSFSNQTSFKKGLTPWNKGTAAKGICNECGKEYLKYIKTLKTCSRKCSTAYRKKSNNFKGTFVKGFTPWNKGVTGYSLKKNYTPTKEAIERAVEKNRKPIIQLSKNGEFIREFKSIAEASSITKISNICRVLKNRQKTAGGFIWKYKQK